ncbi:homocysteine S-methyltransferase family protein [Desulforhopalus sp. IMCC35007]|uniref:homocysteine S-methyltransferase family protein n=1 Tax=Desulforhopalus sp. IMCC35007 TaxID=2569543 RepID=UPI0010AEAE62|nr:homocysteine S-methyltransferase family protein [Desulforhopalus sp. IMCC35007]TKB10680.1 homocysteine S-methyltransferase family protein [Desulforhopalus sp. IMCC35007]
MAAMRCIEEKLEQGQVVLLDGATGTELEKRGVPMNSKAWSAEAIATHPSIVQAVHEDYIQAGADIVTVNSFSTARHMLLPAGLTGQFRHLNVEAVNLAIRARDTAGIQPVAIAGSIAPTTFCADPTKCYPPLHEAYLWYLEQAELLVEAGVDLLLIEMIEDIEQGSLAVKAACSTGVPVWLGFSCRRNDTNDLMLWGREHTLVEGVETIAKIGGSAAFIMHTDVYDTSEAFSQLKSSWKGTLGVYAHSGHFVMPHWKFNDTISPQAYAKEAGEWIKSGARIIGGCCGIGPAHISEIKRQYCSSKF